MFMPEVYPAQMAKHGQSLRQAESWSPTASDLPPNVPPLNFWEILGFEWPIDANRPTAEEVKTKVRERFTRAQEKGALTGRVAWEIRESAKVFLDVNLDWPTLLNYGYQHCDSRAGSRSDAPTPALYVTEAFAHKELSRPVYRSENRTAGPELRYLEWDYGVTFADLMRPTGRPSMCIGSLSMNGRLIFAFVDSRNRLLCTAADVDEWGLPCLRAYNQQSQASVCIKPPFTTINDTAIRNYISEYTQWIHQGFTTTSFNGTVTDAEHTAAFADEDDSNATTFSTGKFLWFTTC